METDCFTLRVTLILHHPANDILWNSSKYDLTSINQTIYLHLHVPSITFVQRANQTSIFELGGQKCSVLSPFRHRIGLKACLERAINQLNIFCLLPATAKCRKSKKSSIENLIAAPTISRCFKKHSQVVMGIHNRKYSRLTANTHRKEFIVEIFLVAGRRRLMCCYANNARHHSFTSYRAASHFCKDTKTENKAH